MSKAPQKAAFWRHATKGVYQLLFVATFWTCDLSGQETQQVLNMAYPAEGTIARLFVDLRGNPHGGWPTVVGDVNGDGRDDFLWVRWSFQEDTWPDSLLVFGGPHLIGVSGKPIPDVPHLRIHHRTALNGLLPFCRRAVAPVGDADGDGFDDFVITACSFSDAGIGGAGRAIVIFGQAQFPADAELADLKAAGIRSLNIVSRDERRHLGESVNRIGDINGDGLEDIAIGASGPGSAGDTESAGWLYVIFGGYAGRDEIDVSEVANGVSGFLMTGARGEIAHLIGDNLGFEYVEGVGDVNGDGLDDLLVPAKGANRAAGVVYVIYGRPFFSPQLDAADPASFGVEIRGLRENTRFGGSISGAGDVDGDGLKDFVVGEPAGEFGTNGAVYLIYGSRSWPERLSLGDPELRTIEFHPGHPTVSFQNPELFGWWVEGIGDWNGDGFADFAFGAPWQQVEIDKSIGRTFIVYGGTSLPASSLDLEVGTTALPGLVLEGHRPISGFGMAGDVGDIDGDGTQDLLITAATESELAQDRSDSSVNILFRAPFDATTFTLDAIDPPGEGSLEGGDRVRIRGRGFDARATVSFGGVTSPEVHIVHSALVEAITPPSAAEGLVDIDVRQGAQHALLTAAYRYRRVSHRNLVLDPDALRAAGLRSSDIVGLGVRAEAADLNNDGLPDLVISSPFDDRASVHIVFGRTSWPERLEEPDVTIWDEPAVADMAVHFDVGADVDSDGFGDLVLGGRDRDADPFTAPGRSYLLGGYGKNWPQEIELLDALGDGHGVSFSSGPCADTDPVFLHLPNGQTRIALGQVFCAGDETVVSFYEPHGVDTPPNLIGMVRGDPKDPGVFGGSLVAVGDMNGDGWDDLLVGDWASFSPTYLLLGDAELFETGSTINILDLAASGRAVRLTDNALISYFGVRTERVGDFNGDGLPDAIISAEYGGFQLQGRSYILFGSPELGATIRDLDMTQDGATHMRITGEHAGDAAGYGKGIGDINGDGYSDVIILGSYYETKMSKAHVIFGEREPPSAVDMLRLAERGFEILAPEGVAIQGATQSNSSISVVGSDLDGDGQQDLAIPYRTALGEGILVVFGPLVSSGFLRGDANDDGRVDISDSVRILSHLFLGADPSVCRQAMDANDSGTLDLSDAVFLLNGLFQGGPAPPPPYPEPGEDPSPDAIDC